MATSIGSLSAVPEVMEASTSAATRSVFPTGLATDTTLADRKRGEGKSGSDVHRDINEVRHGLEVHVHHQLQSALNGQTPAVIAAASPSAADAAPSAADAASVRPGGRAAKEAVDDRGVVILDFRFESLDYAYPAYQKQQEEQALLRSAAIAGANAALAQRHKVVLETENVNIQQQKKLEGETSRLQFAVDEEAKRNLAAADGRLKVAQKEAEAKAAAVVKEAEGRATAIAAIARAEAEALKMKGQARQTAAAAMTEPYARQLQLSEINADAAARTLPQLSTLVAGALIGAARPFRFPRSPPSRCGPRRPRPKPDRSAGARPPRRRGHARRPGAQSRRPLAHHQYARRHADRIRHHDHLARHRRRPQRHHRAGPGPARQPPPRRPRARRCRKAPSRKNRSSRSSPPTRNRTGPRRGFSTCPIAPRAPASSSTATAS